MTHLWNFVWDLFRFDLQPPIIPKVKADGDTSNFDDYPEADEQAAPRPIPKKDLILFDDF